MMWILGHLASWWGFADLILSNRKCVSELPIVFNAVSYLHELFFIMCPWFGIVFAYGLIFWSNYFTCLSVVIGIASSDGGCLHINYLIFLFQIQSSVLDIKLLVLCFLSLTIHLWLVVLHMQHIYPVRRVGHLPCTPSILSFSYRYRWPRVKVKVTRGQIDPFSSILCLVTTPQPLLFTFGFQYCTGWQKY